MIRGRKLLGLDMSKQANRRLLVIFTYAVFAVVLSIRVRDPYAVGDLGFNFAIVLLIVGRSVFGYLVPWYPFPRNAAEVKSTPEILSVTDPDKTHERLDYDPWQFPDPDERDIAIRNRAYYIAFNVIGFYTFLVWFAGSILLRPDSPRLMPAAELCNLALLPTLIMAFTLPQAIILWSEADLGDELA